MSNIVIGISSGIAAYKIINLIERLLEIGHTVDVMMTKKASYMISPGKIEEMTGRSVYINLFEDNFSYEQVLKRRKVDHIELAKQADLFVIAPATANIMAKMASGIADDFLTTALLATHSPVLICPSMNDVMWYHPATQRNLHTLESFGYEVFSPASGSLACGTEGIGRLQEPRDIAQEITKILVRTTKLKGKKVLVTGGGTIEPIDNVRVITNRGSGKMGKALAEICYRYGAEVKFIHSEQSVRSHLPIQSIPFQSLNDLSEILEKEVPNSDLLFHTAAVSDFTSDAVAGKIESSKEIRIELKPTPKIINRIKKWNPKIQLIGFKAITSNSGKEISLQSEKLFNNANTDYVVVNDVSRHDIGFEANENEVYVVSRDQKVHKIDKASKIHVAEEILKIVFSSRPQAGGLNRSTE